MLVDYCFTHGEEICPGEVGGAHGDAFGAGRDIGCFIDLRRSGAAEEGDNPSGSGLMAGYETFSA